jgi:DNA-binding transcriptional ArsR family regulator
MQHVRSIDEPSAIRVATEPHRTQILEILLSGPQTISSLGILLDKHPAWIRHHIKALEAADLVELSEVRTTRNYTEKFYRATAGAFTISMLLRPSRAEGPALMGLVSHDLAVELLASAEGERPAFRAAVTGSLDGLIGVRQGLADIAGCHLLDADTGEYNVPYARHILPDRDVVVVTLAHREQGLMTAPGNPVGLATFTDVA